MILSLSANNPFFDFLSQRERVRVRVGSYKVSANESNDGGLRSEAMAAVFVSVVSSL